MCIRDRNLSVGALLVALTIFFIILGCFLDGISVIVLTTSIIMPMVTAVGIDPIWFGIYLVIVVEMSQITPPVGFNLFVIQGLTGIDILRIAKAAFPLEGGEASVSTTADTMIWGMEANFRMTPTVMGIKAIAKSGKNTAILGCKNVVFRMLKSARRKVPQTKMKTATGNIGLSNAESGGIKNPMMTPAARTVVPSTIFLPGRQITAQL